MTRVAIRVDASLAIGTGHVTRMLTLADALRERGVTSVFLGREHEGHLLDTILAKGFDVLALGPPRISGLDSATAGPIHATWLGASWPEDADLTRAALSASMASVLVVDHYALDERWEAAVSRQGLPMVCIDDLADRRHVCELLLDQNLGRVPADYESLVPASCELLIGPKWALVRPEFGTQRANSLAHRQRPFRRRVLISMGGVDRANTTMAVLRQLATISTARTATITVVLGSRCPWVEDIYREVSTLRLDVTVVVDVPNLSTLMASSDLAICAAGTTTWECCTLGLPTILIPVAENQIAIASAMRNAGAAFVIAPADLPKELPTVFDGLLRSVDCLRMLSARAAALTDGSGAFLVAERISKLMATSPDSDVSKKRIPRSCSEWQ